MGGENSKESEKVPKTDIKLEYTLHVKTGDRFGMGTDANVTVAFYNKHGDRSRDFNLDNLFKNDFESGHTDEFHVELEDEDFGDPVYIEISRDTAGLGDAWFCEFVKVFNVKADKEHIFPVHRWIPANSPVKLREYDSLLPQDDENTDQRQKELEKKREIYVPILNELTGLVKCKELPPEENFSITSRVDIKARSKRLLFEAKLLEITSEKWTSLKDLEGIYKEPHFPVPMAVDRWKSDIEFGYQRLVGNNPLEIRLCTKIPDKFAANEADLQPLIEDMTISEAIDQKRLFIIDYKILHELPCADGREIHAPMALFFVNKEKYLMPVAIQLYQDPKPDNPVFYPSDPEYTWIMAKCYFNMADFSVQGSVRHLGFTHLIAEAVALATHRYLSPSHPLFRFLSPHFLYLLAINNKALGPLMGEGGFLHENTIIGHVGAVNLIKRTFATWRLNVEGSLQADLKDRGVADPEVLPNYHYRDDALILHKAYFNYVKEFLENYYDDPAKISGDEELQEWARFIGGQSKYEGEVVAGIKGFPNGGSIRTREELTKVLADILFLCSASHAAVNFGQYDTFGFPPASPGWLDGKPPKDKTALTEPDIIDQLPDKQRTLAYMALTRLLSTRDANSLGDFEMQYMYDPIGLKSVERFRAELKEVGDIIEKRNETREEKYLWLHPREVPNSISI